MTVPRCNAITRQYETGGPCQNDEAPLHTCPFEQLVRESDEECTCCAECEQRCSDDI